MGNASVDQVVALTEEETTVLVAAAVVFHRRADVHGDAETLADFMITFAATHGVDRQAFIDRAAVLSEQESLLG